MKGSPIIALLLAACVTGPASPPPSSAGPETSAPAAQTRPIAPAPTPAQAPMPAAWRVTEVYDGDTFMVDLPAMPAPLNRASIRVRGVDAPELGARAKCETERSAAIKARDFTAAFLAAGPLQLDDLGWDKYGGRIDARVQVQGRDLAAALIAAGLARAYDGGKRRPWC